MPASPISPRLSKGAFIEYSNRFGRNWMPNIIAFQYNPESMTRKLEGWKEESDKDKAAQEGATAQPFDPGETLDFKLELDAGDLLDNPVIHPLAVVAGVTDRIAAIEMLMYPVDDSYDVKGLLKSVTTTLGGAVVSSAGTGLLGGILGGAAGGLVTKNGFDKLGVPIAALKIPKGVVPTVLFAWSPGRIVPVRITSFSVEEQAFTPNLYVHRATISITLRIMMPKNIPCTQNEGDKKAVTAYNIYQQQKRDFAAMNIASQAADVAEAGAGLLGLEIPVI